MRIIAGQFRGRTLEAPPGISTRPTGDRVREALFSMLASRVGSFDGLRVADLYAGSGALGLEALSRGAAHATFVETDRGAFEAVSIDPVSRTVRVVLAPAGEFTASALLRIEQPAAVKGAGMYRAVRQFNSERGGLVIPLGTTATTVELTAEEVKTSLRKARLSVIEERALRMRHGASVEKDAPLARAAVAVVISTLCPLRRICSCAAAKSAWATSGG